MLKSSAKAHRHAASDYVKDPSGTKRRDTADISVHFNKYAGITLLSGCDSGAIPCYRVAGLDRSKDKPHEAVALIQFVLLSRLRSFRGLLQPSDLLQGTGLRPNCRCAMT